MGSDIHKVTFSRWFKAFSLFRGGNDGAMLGLHEECIHDATYALLHTLMNLVAVNCKRYEVECTRQTITSNSFSKLAVPIMIHLQTLAQTLLF
jgi:hypothetical protein